MGGREIKKHKKHNNNKDLILFFYAKSSSPPHFVYPAVNIHKQLGQERLMSLGSLNIRVSLECHRGHQPKDPNARMDLMASTALKHLVVPSYLWLLFISEYGKNELYFPWSMDLDWLDVQTKTWPWPVQMFLNPVRCSRGVLKKKRGWLHSSFHWQSPWARPPSFVSFLWPLLRLFFLISLSS